MANFIVNIAEGAEQDIVDAAKKVVTYVDGIVVNDIEPAVHNFFAVIVPAEVAALKPYAQEAIKEIVENLPALLIGGAVGFWAAIAPALALTAQKAEAAGIAAAQPAVLAAVGAVIADASVGQ